MPLNADHLEAFLAIVETGTYHRAAEHLFITQSAVTQRVQALEAEIGQRLFVRAGRGVTPTEAGKRLAGYARERREAERALLSALRGEGEGLVGRLALACGSAEAHTWLVPLAAALAREQAGLDLTLAIDDALDPVALLESARVDAVVAEIPVRRRGLRSRRLGETGYVLVVAPEAAADWPDEPDAACLRGLRVVDFHPRDRISLDHLALCLPGEDWSDLRRHFVNDTRAILDWVLAGGGMSVLPVGVVAPHVSAGRLRRLYPGVESRRPLYWIAPEGRTAPGLAGLAGRLERMMSGTGGR